MRFFAFITFGLPALAAITPTPYREKESTDIAVLNFALRLEQLGNALYNEGLRKYSENDFSRDGLPSYTHGRFLQIQQDERIHTAFFSEAVKTAGSPVVSSCKYRWSLSSPKDLVLASLRTESLAAAAYTYALGVLKSGDYRVAIGTILSVKARHAGWINSAILKNNPWNTAFDVPLSFRQAWTLANKYIIDCPPEDAKLVPSGSVDTFSQLEIVGDLIPGEKGQARFHGVDLCEEKAYQIVFKTGVGEFPAKLKKDGYFIVPNDVAHIGTSFVFVTSNDDSVCDENIIAGPALYQFNFSSYDNPY